MLRTMTNAMPKDFKTVLDFLASGLLVLLLIHLVLREPTPELPREAIGMLLMFYLGLLFACSYLAPQKLVLFRVLGFVAHYLSYPRRREMALVYSVVFFTIAAFYLVKVVNSG